VLSEEREAVFRLIAAPDVSNPDTIDASGMIRAQCGADVGLFQEMDTRQEGLVHLPEFNTYLRRIYLKREAFHPGQGRSWLERFLEAMRLTLAVSSAENALINQARIYRSVLGV